MTYQGRTGIRNRPGKFPDDLPPYPSKIVNKFRNHLSPRKNYRIFTYTLQAHQTLPKCKHGQSAPATYLESLPLCSDSPHSTLPSPYLTVDLYTTGAYETMDKALC